MPTHRRLECWNWRSIFSCLCCRFSQVIEVTLPDNHHQRVVQAKTPLIRGRRLLVHILDYLDSFSCCNYHSMRLRLGPVGTLSTMAWQRGLRLGKAHIPLNFASIHYTYFISISLLCSVIFWVSSDPKFSVTYVDSLFLVISGITETGLNTVNLSTLTTWQQTILCLLMLFGGSVWVSIGLLIARERSFRRVLKPDRAGLCQDELAEEHINDNPSVTRDHDMQNCTTGDLEITDASHNRVWSRRHSVERAGASVGPAIQHTAPLPKPDTHTGTVRQSEDLHVNPLAFLNGKTIGRKGYFINLTREEKRKVNIIEHRAMRLLATIVPLYFTL